MWRLDIIIDNQRDDKILIDKFFFGELLVNLQFWKIKALSGKFQRYLVSSGIHYVKQESTEDSFI